MIKKIINQSKKSFSMMMAIFLLILISTMSVIIFNLSNQAINTTVNQYQKEQATILLYNYTELAIMYLLHHNRVKKNSCIEEIVTKFNKDDLKFDINIKIYYIGYNKSLLGCGNILEEFSGKTPFDRTMFVLLDVYVIYKDINSINNKNFSLHRRSIQKL